MTIGSTAPPKALEWLWRKITEAMPPAAAQPHATARPLPRFRRAMPSQQVAQQSHEMIRERTG
jgi:hypothetical protein